MSRGKWMLRIVLPVIVLLMVMTIAVLSRLQAFELPDSARQRHVVFNQGEERLEGTLLLPDGISSPPVVLLVHGDGAQDRWSAGGYLPLVNYLLSQGIAVFSWDKPGVGSSQGNWLAQSMADRADEAAQALEKLNTLPELKNSRLGFLGFSQAGWVVPRASRQSNADFAVLIGAAINCAARDFILCGKGCCRKDLPPMKQQRPFVPKQKPSINSIHHRMSSVPAFLAAIDRILSDAMRWRMPVRILTR